MGLLPQTSSINPVTLQAVKTQLRIVNDLVDSNSIPYSSNDAALSVHLQSAFEWVETETRQQLFNREYQLTLASFPRDGMDAAWDGFHIRHEHEHTFLREIKLPKPPLQSVASITYIDPTGVQQTLDPSTYIVDNTKTPGRIVLAPGKVWPQTNSAVNNVKITFTAGYGNNSGCVPMILKQAILLLVGAWYENREDTTAYEPRIIPIGVQNIVNQNMYPEAVG